MIITTIKKFIKRKKIDKNASCYYCGNQNLSDLKFIRRNSSYICNDCAQHIEQAKKELVFCKT